METVRFYFSLRSPYSWLGFLRINEAASRFSIDIEYQPVVAAEEAMADVLGDSSRFTYLIEDVGRFASAYGLAFRMPEPVDVDWRKAHAAYLGAAEQGKGVMYAQGAYAARFSENKSIAEDSVIAELAIACGLEPESVLAATTDRRVHHRLIKAAIDAKRDQTFGVPYFVWGQRRYWGNDRIEWLLRDLLACRGESVPDLRSDKLAHPAIGEAGLE